MLRPRALAREFVHRLIVDAFFDFLDLTQRDPTDSAYKVIDQSVRRQKGLESHDLVALERAVTESVPEGFRGSLVMTLTTLSNAYTDELVAREHTAYLIGLAVGQAFPTVMQEDRPARTA